MRIEEFNHDDHYDKLITWLAARQMPESMARNLPAIGFVAYEDEIPVATIFLRRVEGDIGIIDGLCSNPEVNAETRNEVIDTLVQLALDHARGLEMENVIAWTRDTHCLTRSIRHGFRLLPDALINIELKG